MKLSIHLNLYFLLPKMDSNEILSALETDFEDSGSDFILLEVTLNIMILKKIQTANRQRKNQQINGLMFQVCIINHKKIKLMLFTLNHYFLYIIFIKII